MGKHILIPLMANIGPGFLIYKTQSRKILESNRRDKQGPDSSNAGGTCHDGVDLDAPDTRRKGV